MEKRDMFSATLAVELVKITMQHVNAMLAAGASDIDVDAAHTHTLVQYREALSAVEEGVASTQIKPTETGAAAPPAAGVTLTDEEWVRLSNLIWRLRARGMNDDEELLRGLLARAAKEETR
jgi:transcriptional/translational regulatory protein YebC/TACO1